MLRRYVVTGAPGAGKTSILKGLQDRGYEVVEEAATDVIAREQALGVEEPWREADFVDKIVALQRQRQLAPVPANVRVQVFDRSPLCTLALALYLGEPVSPRLAREVTRVRGSTCTNATCSSSVRSGSSSGRRRAGSATATHWTSRPCTRGSIDGRGSTSWTCRLVRWTDGPTPLTAA